MGWDGDVGQAGEADGTGVLWHQAATVNEGALHTGTKTVTLPATQAGSRRGLMPPRVAWTLGHQGPRAMQAGHRDSTRSRHSFQNAMKFKTHIISTMF